VGGVYLKFAALSTLRSKVSRQSRNVALLAK
jgi:hypothetical protein